MRVCVQRVRQASVTVQRELVGEIGRGMLVLVGIGQEDGRQQVEQMVEKLVGLRIFEDDRGKMNRSLSEVHGEMLVVSQFTLWGDCRKGRRPSFTSAAPPELAEPLYELFVEQVAGQGIRVATGQFAAQMDVALVNDGPVTLLLESW
ncbi:MAG: D-aminoacyl-tRNA deacylase [Pirellulaceae bacterium]|nr:D-aminoacyl-tRNA deacylase [Pirellulaceae bacterium]